ncbi:MAG: exo-alpha-sialidase [Chitinispirillia bacterium]
MNTQQNDKQFKPGILLQEFVFTEASFPSCHASTILELKTGELLCAFFGGTKESHPDVEIRLSHKTAGGAWTLPESVADGAQSDNEQLSTGNPILFQPAGGDIILFYKVFRPGAPWWGEMKISCDMGKTWSKAQRIPSGLLGPDKNKPIQLNNGIILVPSAIEEHYYGVWRVHIERSTDNGETWTKINLPNSEVMYNAIQPTLLTYPDGRIQMLCRTRSEHGFIAQSWSEDSGITWSPLTPSELPNNNSGIDGVTLKDGRQLLVYNHSTRLQPDMGHKGRGILNVALSRDGFAWEAALILDYLDESEKQFSYPAVIQTQDNLVHIVYTWHRKRIKHVVLDPEKLQAIAMSNGKWPESIKP